MDNWSRVLVPEEHIRYSLIGRQQITHTGLLALPFEYVAFVSFNVILSSLNLVKVSSRDSIESGRARKSDAEDKLLSFMFRKPIRMGSKTPILMEGAEETVWTHG
jgi:hypothetical protein